jgi:aminoglycoside phosphotransferase
MSIPPRAVAVEQDGAMISGRPQHADVAETVLALIAGRSFDVVWRNDLGGLTFEVFTGRDEREFIKWAPAGSGIDLLREALRLDWASSFIRVPHVIDTGEAADGAWMRTAGLPGDSAVSPRWINDASTAVAAIGQALRQLHERLPVDECPFSWSISERLADACERAEHGQLDVTDWEAEHPGVSLPAALRIPNGPSITGCSGHLIRDRIWITSTSNSAIRFA